MFLIISNSENDNKILKTTSDANNLITGWSYPGDW